jgi:hypothetical protein
LLIVSGRGRCIYMSLNFASQFRNRKHYHALLLLALLKVIDGCFYFLVPSDVT